MGSPIITKLVDAIAGHLIKVRLVSDQFKPVIGAVEVAGLDELKKYSLKDENRYQWEANPLLVPCLCKESAIMLRKQTV